MDLLAAGNQCFSIIKTLTLYPQFFVLYFVTSLMSDVLNNYARGIEKVSDVAIGGIIGSVSMLTLNVLFLLVFKWGLDMPDKVNGKMKRAGRQM